MIIETLIICSLIFATPYYDCDNEWAIFIHDDYSLQWEEKEYRAYILFEIGNSNATQIHLTYANMHVKWYDYSELYYFLLSGTCQCNPNDKAEEELKAKKEIQNV